MGAKSSLLSSNESMTQLVKRSARLYLNDSICRLTADIEFLISLVDRSTLADFKFLLVESRQFDQGDGDDCLKVYYVHVAITHQVL